MKKIKTVVSGLGRIGWQFHMLAIHANNGFELAGVCDPLEERLSEAKTAYSVNCYENYYEMIDKEKPDLSVICSPTHLHAEQAVYAMEQGSDVFLDKPMARDLAEAEKIAAAYKHTGRKLMMYQPQRATAETQLLKKIIESGIIGDVFMIKTAAHDYVERNDWQAFKKYGGGMLNNFGAHAIDRALYLAGSYAKKISASMFKIASLGDADDVVKILIETMNGIALDIDINTASMANSVGREFAGFADIVVYGQSGAAKIEHNNDGAYWHVNYLDPKKRETMTASDFLAAKDRKYMTSHPKSWHEKNYGISKSDDLDYYDECYKYFALGEEPFVPVVDTMEVMRVIHECRKYAEWNQDE